MQVIIKKDESFIRKEISKEEAIEIFKKQDEKYKVELLEEIKDKKVSLYESGDFVDLCKGPHVESTGKIKSFKLLRISGAYWRGSEKNPMLQRIYGTAFYKKEELKDYLVILARRRGYILLWTAYPIKYDNMKRKLLKEYEQCKKN